MEEAYLDENFEYSEKVSVFVDFPDTRDRLIVYPNPVGDVVNIRGKLAEFEDITLFDSHGNSLTPNIIYQIEGLVQIDMSALREGMYILKTKFKTAKIFKSEK